MNLVPWFMDHNQWSNIFRHIFAWLWGKDLSKWPDHADALIYGLSSMMVKFYADGKPPVRNDHP